MAKFEKCPQAVKDLVAEIMTKYEVHKPLCDAKLRVDLLFAFPEKDELGNYKGDALRHHGCKAVAVTRKIGLKDRVAGRGDAEILIDGEWWEDHKEKDRAGLIDHELMHLDVRKDEEGKLLLDDLNRPKLKIRPHDVEVGWFVQCAKRHGDHSIERRQAAAVMSQHQEFLWPDAVMDLTAKKAA